MRKAITSRQARIVHCKRDCYDVYISDGRDPKTGVRGPWGNPFVIGRDGDRAEVIERYERYLLESPDLLTRLHKLKGKTLKCWCAPQPCHGDVLARHADALG